MNGVSHYVHRPWANTFRCYPELYFQPETVEQVQSIVSKARELQKNVVITGATHSPSIITKTSGFLVNLDRMDRILNIEQHELYTDVTVEAGIRLKNVNKELASRGLALQNLGSISEQSIAGVISTGTHGSSCYHGLISEQIVSLDLVVEDGKVITVNENENADLFKAVLLGLGAFGIIVRAKIRTVKAFNVESRAYVVEFDKLLSPETWSKVFTESEFHRIWWYPYTNKCYVWQADKTSKPAEKPLYSFYGTWLGRLLFEGFLWAAVRWFPRLTPTVEQWLFKRQFDEQAVTRHVGRSDAEINMDCLFKQFVNEWSLPLDNGPNVLKQLRESILEEKWYVHAPIEIRASNTTLPSHNDTSKSSRVGPIYGNITRPLLDPSPKLPYVPPKQVTNSQLTLNLNATMFRPFQCDPPIDEWFATFELTCERGGGRPHWAKNFTRNPWVNSKEYEEWKEIRDKIAPSKIFGGEEWLIYKQLQY